MGFSEFERPRFLRGPLVNLCFWFMYAVAKWECLAARKSRGSSCESSTLAAREKQETAGTLRGGRSGRQKKRPAAIRFTCKSLFYPATTVVRRFGALDSC